jgi:hypothetical protein
MAKSGKIYECGDSKELRIFGNVYGQNIEEKKNCIKIQMQISLQKERVMSQEEITY